MKCKLLVLALLASSPARIVNGQSSGGVTPELAPEVKNLASLVVRLRSMPGVSVTVEWRAWYRRGLWDWHKHAAPRGGPGSVHGWPPRAPATGDKIEFSAKSRFLAAGRKYRLSQEYDSSMPEMAFEAAYDGRRFELLLKNASELRFTATESRDLLNPFLPVVQLQPIAFVGAGDAHNPRARVQWSDLFDEKRVSDRLAKGVVATFGSGAETRPVVKFDVGAVSDGRPVVYRVFVDGPDGQPKQIDEVDPAGAILGRTKFEYAAPGTGMPWAVPIGVDYTYFDDEGRVGASIVAHSTRVEIAPKLSEDAFSIDLMSANSVLDVDSGKYLKGPMLEGSSKGDR